MLRNHYDIACVTGRWSPEASRCRTATCCSYRSITCFVYNQSATWSPVTLCYKLVHSTPTYGNLQLGAVQPYLTPSSLFSPASRSFFCLSYIRKYSVFEVGYYLISVQPNNLLQHIKKKVSYLDGSFQTLPEWIWVNISFSKWTLLHSLCYS
jgi:hypothetical protein